MTQPLQIKPYLAEHTFSDGDIPLLTVSAHLPVWEGAHGKRFNRYYRAYSRAFMRYCQTALLPMAQERGHQAQEQGGAIPDWHASLKTVLTCHCGTLVSLYTDSVEQLGEQRIVLRRGDTWDMASGTPLRLTDFFPPHTHVRKRLVATAREQIEREERLGLYRYLPDWRGRLYRSFHPQHFYIDDEGLYFFYQLCAIAPPGEGIPTFFLPYDEKSGPYLPTGR